MRIGSDPPRREPAGPILAAVGRRVARYRSAARTGRRGGPSPGAAATLVLATSARLGLGASPERAVEAVRREADGPLAESLATHARRAAGSGTTGLAGVVAEYREEFPELARAVTLLAAAGTERPADRAETLDRAVSTVLDGVEARVAESAAALAPAATALYAFGVVLPLALVGLVPALGAAGAGLPPGVVVWGYGLVLPLGLVVAGSRLLAGRAVPFPPPSIRPGVEGTPDRRAGAVAAGLFAAAGGWVVGDALRPWGGPVAALGVGIGTALVARYGPLVRVRDRIERVEAGLPDALSRLGSGVTAGTSVETGVPAVAADLDEPVGRLLGDAHRRRRALGLDIGTALVGPDGTFADSPSVRVREAGRLLALSAAEGPPAGPVLDAFAAHLDRLAAVEARAGRRLRRTTDGLTHTGAFFAPLVAGVTVAIADAAVGGDPTGLGGPLGAATLGPALGWYVLCSAAVLTGLAVGFERGLDPATAGLRVGRALLSATATYLLAAVGASLVL